MELGCGGTVSRLLEENAEIYSLAMSKCQISVPSNYSENILEIEYANSCRSLGIDGNKTFILDYPVREFPEHRQSILQKFVDIRKTISPDIVFVPCSNDIHQDHNTVHMEATRAFKNTNLIGYELPWNNFKMINNFYVKLSEKNIQDKINALSHYRSQGFRNYTSDKFVRSLAIVRGIQGGAEFCESFELIKTII